MTSLCSQWLSRQEQRQAQCADGVPAAVRRRARKATTEPSGGMEGDAETPLDSLERACGDIVERLLPLPPKPEPVPARRRGDRPLLRQGVRSTLALNGNLEFMSPSKEPAVGSTALPQLQQAAAANAAALRLIKRPVKWEFATEMQQNVIGLVQGASANKVERDVQGKIRFVCVPGIKRERYEDDSDDAEDLFGDAGKAVHAQPAVARVAPQFRGARGTQEMMGHPLQQFRKKLFKKYSSVAEAFDGLNCDRDKKLDMREWCEVLTGANMCGMFEARVIFELMDANRDGTLTIHEFNVGIEAIAPVTNLVTLRKRLVCLGFTSMLQAIAVMDGGGEDTTMQPLLLPDFAAALRRVWVIEDKEHRAIFNLVRDPADQVGRASLSDLACGLAGVSPCLLLAEARQQLESKYGSLTAAYDALEDSWLTSPAAFEEKGSRWLGMTKAEAAKMFRFTDIDGSGELSRAEIVGSLRLSMPSVHMEDVRRKVQQTYRGVESALRDGVAQEGKDLDDNLRFTEEELQEILEPVDMTRVEKKLLIRYLSATSEHGGGLTLSEFHRGVRLLAPSCVLEGVRLQLLRNHERVGDAFRYIPLRTRRAPLCKAEVLELLRDAGVTVMDSDAVFDILDVRSTGVVTLTEIIAALQGCAMGTRRWVSRREREATIERSVHEELAPIHGSISDLKTGLRRGLSTPEIDKASKERRNAKEGLDEDWRLPPESKERSYGSRSSPTGAGVTYAAMAAFEAAEAVAAQEAARLSRHASPQATPRERGDKHLTRHASMSEAEKEIHRAEMRKTFINFSASLEALPPQQAELKQKAVDAVRGYFVNHQQVFGAQEDMLRHRYSKAALHRELTELRRTVRGRPLLPSTSAPTLQVPRKSKRAVRLEEASLTAA